MFQAINMSDNVVYVVGGPLMSAVHVLRSRLHHWASIYDVRGK
jgi:hypothetical protein